MRTSRKSRRQHGGQGGPIRRRSELQVELRQAGLAAGDRMGQRLLGRCSIPNHEADASRAHRPGFACGWRNAAHIAPSRPGPLAQSTSSYFQRL